MEPEAFESLLKNIKPYTDHIFLHVLGEPMTHPKILTLLRHAETSNIMVNLTTNGLLLDRLTDSSDVYRPLRQINISLHCMGGETDITAQAGYLLKALHRVKWINAHTNSIVSLRLWNITANEKQVFDFNNMACDMIRSMFGTNETGELRLSHKAGIKLADRIYLNWDHRFRWPGDDAGSSVTGRAFCHGLRDQIAILVDGTVVPCCLDVQGAMDLGNIFSDSMAEILENKRTQQILKGFSEGRAVEELCRKCTFRERF
jgi:radical SAM protein with 4Fe4S-binding SPASM domain